ncbi:LOW QUALITY PROTEIN: cell division cycle 7-related protein kinase-like [Cydia splendana]|uniref:LOW QUALITY PROTEIN: cell division cycle 7-related protein kinase-like n=1 Tax=Cydia splendana TaxID=1100963 RepID=UPI00300C1F13
MSRIRGIEAKVKKEILHSAKNKNGPDTACEKNDAEKDQVKELLGKIPVLAKTFDIHRKIGEGTFSSVYLGSMRQDASVAGGDKRWFAVKHLVPTTHPTRVAHELRCLRDIGGKNHVIGVELCLRNLDHVVFIMPYIPHQKFSEYVGDMDANELRQYMRALLTALRHVHTFGVIHRDVKPSNFLYDRERRRYALVDFGLAQHTAAPTQPPPAHQPLKRTRDDDSLLPGAKRMALDLCVRRAARSPAPAPAPVPAPRACACAGAGGVCGECAVWAPPRANRAGTQGFRPPEVFFKYPHQSTAVDMWAAGVILASVLSGRYPFFRATDDLTALAEITELLGTEALQRTAQALGNYTIHHVVILASVLSGRYPFFRATDDLTTLAEITELLGTEALQRTAQALGCRLVTSTRRHGLCLRKLSAHLRGAPPAHDAPPCAKCGLRRARCVCRDDTPPHTHDPLRFVCGFPDAAFALAARLLEPDPRARITAADALRHPFLAQPL